MVSELLDEDFGNPRPDGLGDDATWISVATGENTTKMIDCRYSTE